MKRLGLEYLDLYLIHFPLAFQKTKQPGEETEVQPISVRETWQALEELVEQGLVRNSGVSNFNVAQIRDICTYAKVKPACLQVEMHPYLSQEKLLRFCRERGITVTAYSSLGAGSYVPLGAATQEMSCLDDPVMKQVAAAHGKSPA